MGDLYVFDDGSDWYVAHNEEDARRLRHEFLGDDSRDHEPFIQMRDEDTLSILCNEAGERDDHGVGVKKTCAEWAREVWKPEMLCSRDL